MHRFLARLWRLRGREAPAAGADRGRRRAAARPSREGDELELMRKAHWAIEKVTGDLRRGSRSTPRSPR